MSVREHPLASSATADSAAAVRGNTNATTDTLNYIKTCYLHATSTVVNGSHEADDDGGGDTVTNFKREPRVCSPAIQIPHNYSKLLRGHNGRTIINPFSTVNIDLKI